MRRTLRNCGASRKEIGELKEGWGEGSWLILARVGDDRCCALDSAGPPFYDGKRMEVDFTPDLEAKLDRLAAEQGRDTKALVREAVERFVNYDEWFIREVEKGLAAADRGEFIEHEEIGKLIDRRYPG